MTTPTSLEPPPSPTETRARAARRWHFITPEFPPELGGVGDYVFSLSKTLAENGDEVHVWCPRADKPRLSPAGVTIHSDLGGLNFFDFWRVGRALSRFPKPRCVVLQWVPHGFRWRSMNLPFCLWMWLRARVHGDDLSIMVHEAFLAFRKENWRQSAAALVHRVMTIVLLLAAGRIWVSTPRWEKAWRPYALMRQVSFIWLPIPSNVPVAGDSRASAALRNRYSPAGERIIGHFGTFGCPITPMLHSIVPLLLEKTKKTVVLFIGQNGDEFRKRLIRDYPQYESRIHATGAIPALDRLSAYLSACDVMIQPFPDGVSARRSSLMAPLAHGVPIVTTAGSYTEPLWLESNAVAIAPVGDSEAFVSAACRLLDDDPARHRAATVGKAFYQDHFSIERISGELASIYDGKAENRGGYSTTCAS